MTAAAAAQATPMPSPTNAPITVSPAPTDDEVVAIMAAMHALWPRPVVAAEATTARNTSWRFSGRWWSRPVPARRERPFR